MSKREPKTTQRAKRAAKRAPAKTLDQQRWDTIRASESLKQNVRAFLVGAARGVDQRASDNKAWRTTYEIHDHLETSGHLEPLALYRSRADRIAALVTVLKDMVAMGAIDGGRRTLPAGPVTGGEENVWKMRAVTFSSIRYVLHVEAGRVTRLSGHPPDGEEALVERGVFANIYDVHDGEIVYGNVAIYATWTGGVPDSFAMTTPKYTECPVCHVQSDAGDGHMWFCERSRDWEAVKRWLRIVDGGGEG